MHNSLGNTRIIFLLILLATGVLIYFAYQRAQHLVVTPVPISPSTAVVTKNTPKQSAPLSPTTTPKQQASPLTQIVKNEVQPDAEKIKKFWESARIKIELPKDLTYVAIDIDSDSLIALQGLNKGAGTDLMFIARQGRTDPSEIGPFINEIGLKNSLDKSITPLRLPSPNRDFPLQFTTGLKSVLLWRLQGKNLGRIITLSERIDKKGSYILIYTFAQAELKKSEELIVSALKNAKTN